MKVPQGHNYQEPKRKLNVNNTKYASIIFDEESLEMKNEYIKKYK